MPPDGRIPPAAPDYEEALAAEPAAPRPDGGELPAATLEGATAEAGAPDADGESREAPAAAVEPPRRRARARRRRTAPERGARADAAAGDVLAAVVATADGNGGAPSAEPGESPPEILAYGEAADAAGRETMPPDRASENGLGEVAAPAPLATKRTTRRTRRRATAARPAEGGGPPEAAQRAGPVEVERDEAPMPNEPERDQARMPNEPERDEAPVSQERERDEAPAPDEPAFAATVMADRRDAGPPRRGWWSRFVRKDE
jgi:hypothetical protein